MDGDPTSSRTRQRHLRETFARFATAKLALKCQNLNQQENSQQQSFVVCGHNNSSSKNELIGETNNIMNSKKNYVEFKVENQDNYDNYENEDVEMTQIAPLRLKENTKSSSLTCYNLVYQRAAKEKLVANRREQVVKYRSSRDKKFERHENNQSSQIKLKQMTYPFRESSGGQLSVCHNNDNYKKVCTASNEDNSIDNNHNYNYNKSNSKKQRPKLKEDKERGEEEEEGGKEDSSSWEKETCTSGCWRRLSYDFSSSGSNYVKKAIKSYKSYKCPFFHSHHHHHVLSNNNNNNNNKLLDSNFKFQTNSNISLKHSIVITIIFLLLILGQSLSTFSFAYQLANNLIANNLPPKFITTQAGQTSNSEIVVRVKEGAASIGKLIFTLKGEDPDDDPLTFGVLGSMASDLLRIENVPGNQANVYLRKELDRETTESYQVVITLTDGKLGRGNWVS